MSIETSVLNSLASRVAVRKSVFWPPFLLLFCAMAYSFVDLKGYLSLTTAINAWILDTFAWLFSASTFTLLVTTVAVFVSPLGRVRIGGATAKPILTKWRWFSITLCTTVATGILFWSAAEPMYHIYAPPASLDIQPNSADARQFAMATMFMHWSFTPYAIYCVPALVFALCYYNLNKPFSIGSSLSPVFGHRAFGIGGKCIDALALFALVAGMAASLGTGILVLGGGIEAVVGIANTHTVMALVATTIVSTFVVSAVSGLHRGIARLSNLNARVFVFIFAFVLVFGPTHHIVSLGLEGVIGYGESFVARSLNQYPEQEDGWSNSWTVFYWANWFAWAPVTALFLGRISRGYTVREFIVINLILPAVCAILWISAFSGATLHFDQVMNGRFHQVMLEQGPESVIFMLFEALPMTVVLALIFIGVTFLSFVTAADSNTDVISNLCSRENGDGSNLSSPLILKYIWGISIGVIAWVMVSFASIDGVKMMSNLGGLPAMLIIIATNLSLLILVKRAFFGEKFEPVHNDGQQRHQEISTQNAEG